MSEFDGNQKRQPTDKREKKMDVYVNIGCGFVGDI